MCGSQVPGERVTCPNCQSKQQSQGFGDTVAKTILKSNPTAFRIQLGGVFLILGGAGEASMAVLYGDYDVAYEGVMMSIGGLALLGIGIWLERWLAGG